MSTLNAETYALQAKYAANPEATIDYLVKAITELANAIKQLDEDVRELKRVATRI